MLLTVENVSVAYGNHQILDRINLALADGEVLAVVGASGCGKSTLLNAITGMLGSGGQLTAGSISYREQQLPSPGSREWQRLRGREIGRIYQDAGASFCPIRKIGEQLYEAVQAHEGKSRRDIRTQAEAIMERLHLPTSILESYPFQLSGGMAQRTGLLAALLLKPSLLLADEPTSALDTITQVQVVKELQELTHDLGLAVLLVTHQLAIARALADRIIIMQDGRIIEEGPRDQIFGAPQAAYTRELLMAQELFA